MSIKNNTNKHNDGWDNINTGWEICDLELRQTQQDIELSDDIHNINDIEYIFVLAGGITDKGQIHPWVERRLLLAKKLYKVNTSIKIICLGGGSYHVKPIMNHNGFVIHESTACAEFLIKLGVNPNNIYREWSSYDTIANGFFGFTNYIVPLNIKRAHLITSEFHMDRAKGIFEWINTLFNNICDISYLTVKDEGLDSTIITDRTEREKTSLNNLQKHVISKIDTVEKLHKWFYCEHKAYCSNVELIRDTNSISEEQKKSY